MTRNYPKGADFERDVRADLFEHGRLAVADDRPIQEFPK